MNNTKKTVVPIFYATDENYLPYLIVSLLSLKKNASKGKLYKIYVLMGWVTSFAKETLAKYEDEDFTIECVDVSAQMEAVKTSLQLRDYYTGATYYRIFVAKMFPEYEKALYIDSDTVLIGDIYQLYNHELGENWVGAVVDGAVASVPAFSTYTEKTLGIVAEKYFNAGVLLMNLAQFRKGDFYGKFCALLQQYKFCVAQDQDYLNVICKDKVLYLNEEWNKMPIGGAKGEPKLIHYNLTLKPWHYKDILYQEYFWEYAKQTEFYDLILQTLDAYSQEQKDADALAEKNLIALALEEAERADNYFKKYCQN